MAAILNPTITVAVKVEREPAYDIDRTSYGTWVIKQEGKPRPVYEDTSRDRCKTILDALEFGWVVPNER